MILDVKGLEEPTLTIYESVEVRSNMHSGKVVPGRYKEAGHDEMT